MAVNAGRCGPVKTLNLACWPVVLCLSLMICRAETEIRPPVDWRDRAAFVCNLTRFTHWPSNAFRLDSDPLVIGIIGKDTLGRRLDDLVSGQVVRTHPLKLMRLLPGDDLSKCHVLFISSSEKDYLDIILAEVGDKPVLTVSDLAGLAERGVIVELPQRDDRITVNLKNAESLGLKISSKLLGLARIVETRREKPKS